MRAVIAIFVVAPALSGCTILLGSNCDDYAEPSVENDADSDSSIDSVALSDGDTLCTEEQSLCVDGIEQQCLFGNWIDVQNCPGGCHPNGQRCLRLIPSNVAGNPIELAHVSVIVDDPIQLDTDECDASVLGPPQPLAMIRDDLLGNIELCIIVMKTLTIGVRGSIRASGTRPLVILARGAVVIAGVIDVSADGARPGAGVNSSETASEPCNGDVGIHHAHDDSGGGGGGHGRNGGTGGLGGDEAGGSGGSEYGEESLIPLSAGCGGGDGAERPNTGNAGAGGAGGGALQISSEDVIILRSSGLILAGGGGGGGGQEGAAGGGGGAGGAILLESFQVVIDGVIAANGGGGGGGGGERASDFAQGSAGQNGTANLNRAIGGSGGDEESNRGGNGGAGLVRNTTIGETAPDAIVNGGGGGGAAGRIRINTIDADTNIGGIVSPFTSSTYSEGVVSTY